jgi:site-specific DNA-methyltransferase (adenine-specific)
MSKRGTKSGIFFCEKVEKLASETRIFLINRGFRRLNLFSEQHFFGRGKGESGLLTVKYLPVRKRFPRAPLTLGRCGGYAWAMKVQGLRPEAEPAGKRLLELEQTIRQDLRAFIRVGSALMEIKNQRLYQQVGFNTFEAYCRQRLGLGRQHGYRLVTAAALVEDLSPIGDNLVSHESQVRPLSRLSHTRDRKKAFRLACKWAMGHPPTGKRVRQAVTEILALKKSRNANRKGRPAAIRGVRLICGDSRDPSLLPPGIADLVCGSMPYNLGLPYDAWNDNLPEQEYIQCLHDWFQAARIWANPAHGRLAVISAVDTHRHGPFPLAAHVVGAAVSAGWKYRATIIWVEGSTKGWPDIGKRVTAPEYHCAAECILVFHRGNWERPIPSGGGDVSPEEYLEWSRGVWVQKSHFRSPEGHPAANPPEISERLIRQFSFRGDLVLDPWCGSGTTPVAAHRLKRRAIGIDISPQYASPSK